MFARQLDCQIVPQFCVEGEEYESSLDDQCAFSFSFEHCPKALRHRNVTGFLRNRELHGNRVSHRPRIVYDVNAMDTFTRGVRRLGLDKYGKQTWEPVYHALQASSTEYAQCFNDSNIAAISPDGNTLVRTRINDEDERVYDVLGRGTKLLYICRMSPKYLVWPISMVLEDIPLSEPLTFLFSRNNGLIASVLMDICVEEREARGPQQGVIRVDLLVPWAGVQLCTINTACLALREDRARKTIEKRCVRAHDRGVVINCGFQIIFLTVTPKIVYPLSVPGEIRKTYYFESKSYLGFESRPSDAIEKRHDVDVGETLSCRYAVAFPSRAYDHSMKTRLEMRQHPITPLTQRLVKHPDVGDPTNGSKQLFMARQVVPIEPLVVKFLSRWYAAQRSPAKFVGAMDYEADVLSIDEVACCAQIGVFVKAEVRVALPPRPEEREDGEGETRRVKNPREKTQFDVVYVEFDWLIIEGGPRNPRVCMRKAGIGNSEIFDKNRWYTGNARVRYETHEVQQRESSKAVIELQPVLQPEMLLQQRSTRNRFHNSQSDLSFDFYQEESQEESQEE